MKARQQQGVVQEVTAITVRTPFRQQAKPIIQNERVIPLIRR